MRLPRDISGRDLARTLKAYGYKLTRQTGSHMRLTTSENGEHHVTVPAHGELRVGTLAGVLDEVAFHFGVSREDVVERLFGRG